MVNSSHTMARPTLCFLLLLLLSPSVHAIDSLDWLIADSDLVIRGRVIMVALKDTPTQGTKDWEEATITVYETLKGTPPKFDQIKVLRPTTQFKSAPWSEDPSLFLLVAGHRAAYLQSPDFLEGRYLMIDPHARIISLMPFALQRPDNAAYDFNSTSAYNFHGSRNRFVNPLFNAKGEPLSNTDDILSQSRNIVADQKNYRPRLRPAVVEVPNFGVITVPADENWQRYARAQLARGHTLHWILQLSPSTANLRFLQGYELVPYIREGYDQVRMFGGQLLDAPRDYYRNDRTIDFLYAACDDSWGAVKLTYAGNWPTPLDRFETRHHLNRLLADEVLSAWNLPRSGLPLTSVLLERKPIALFNQLTASLVALLLIAWLTTRRQSHILRTLTAFCLIMTLATAALWFRSASCYDSLIFATSISEHEISSSFGQFHYLLLDQGPANARPVPRPPSHASVSLSDMSQVPDHLNYLEPDEKWHKAGIFVSHGHTPPAVRHSPGSPNSSCYAFHLLTLDYPWLVTLFLSLPIFRVLTAAHRARRARRRIANLHCPNCNYDLRHSPRRCPECGLRTPW